jgi:hypothetical protein
VLNIPEDFDVSLVADLIADALLMLIPVLFVHIKDMSLPHDLSIAAHHIGPISINLEFGGNCHRYGCFLFIVKGYLILNIFFGVEDRNICSHSDIGAVWIVHNVLVVLWSGAQLEETHLQGETVLEGQTSGRVD